MRIKSTTETLCHCAAIASTQMISFTGIQQVHRPSGHVASAGGERAAARRRGGAPRRRLRPRLPAASRLSAAETAAPPTSL